MKDKGFGNLKLSLLGAVIIAIPLLFIFQNESAKKKKQENEDYKLENAKLATYNSYLKDLIHLYEVQIKALSESGSGHELPAITVSPVISLPKSDPGSYPEIAKGFGEISQALGKLSPIDYSQKIVDLANAVKSVSNYPNYSDQLTKIANAISLQYPNLPVAIQTGTLDSQYSELNNEVIALQNTTNSILSQINTFSLNVLNSEKLKDLLILETLKKNLEEQKIFLDSLQSGLKISRRKQNKLINDEKIKNELLINIINNIQKVNSPK